jgi:hypothetical protein
MLKVPPPSPRNVAKLAVVVMLAGVAEMVFEHFKHRPLGGKGTVVVAFVFLVAGTVYAFLWALWKGRREWKRKNRQGS